VREFRASWGVLPSTTAKNRSVVKAFFEFCHSNEWTPRNPARMVKNQRGQHNDPRSEQKLPFSDEELRRMYDARDTKYGKREIQFSKATKERKEQGPYAQHRTRWKGQDIADFISVSVHTGLRISDVSTFHIDRMRPDRTTKGTGAKPGLHNRMLFPWRKQGTVIPSTVPKHPFLPARLYRAALTPKSPEVIECC
jgi:integrase